MRRTVVLLALLGIALVVGVVLMNRRVSRPTEFSERLFVGGRPYFWAGVNYPWKSYQDFGTGPWGYSGVADPTTYAEVDADFANLAASGVRIVKWRIFNDGRYSPDFDEEGRVTGLDERFFADLDAALEIARRHDVYLVFTLFGSGLWTTDCTQRGVQLGGHADSLTDSSKRQALIDNAIVPMLRHIGRNDRVLAFEIIAEPEWGIEELHHEEDNRVKVPLADVREFVRGVTDAIHRHTSALATIESNRASYMAHWRGLGLDYFSFSWYDWLEPWEPLDRAARSFTLDRPIVLGEFPSVDSTYYALDEVYDLAYRQGYAGAFAWSYGGADRHGDWQRVADVYLRWATSHWGGINVAGRGGAPDGPVGFRQPPYAFENVQIVSGRDVVCLQADVRVKNPGTYHIQWFLYEATANPSQPLEEQTVSFSEPQRRLFIRLGSLDEAQPYKVSLGLFDEAYQLQKWFEGLAVLRVEHGVPRLQTTVLEDPCGRQTELDNG